MKFNKFIMVGIVLLTILTLCTVNAADNATVDDLKVVGGSEDFHAYSLNDGINEGSSSNDILKVVNDENGISELNYSNCNLDDNIISSSNYGADKLTLIPVSIDVNIVNNSRVDISIPNVTGNVIVIVDNSENKVPLDNHGSASFPLENLSAGSHGLVVIYEGDDTYDAAHTASVFIIPENVGLMSCEFNDIIIGEDLTVTMVLKDEKGNVIANAPIKYSINGVLSNTKTNGKGLLSIAGKAGSVITVVYDGDENIASTNATLTLNNTVNPSIVKVATHFNISGGVITLKGYAVDVQAGEEGIYYATELFDVNGKAISGVPVQFAVNDKIYYRTTLDNGSFIPYKLNMARSGRYTMAFFFNGNENYNSAFASVCVDLSKKPITIKASAKSFKASLKTKKYTVTLSTIVGSSHDGKAHLKSGLKVTLTVNGKTYASKTNSNGKITFKIINLKKKGKYVAKISYEGDMTYESANKSVKLTIK